MKEQWRISKETLVALEEGTSKDGLAAGTSKQKKSSNVTTQFFRFVKLVLLVQAFLFAGWFSSSLWQYYRTQSMQVKDTGYVPQTHDSFHLRSMENNDDPPMEFVGRTESSKQRLDDANALEIRDSLIKRESSTYGSTLLANGHPIDAETTQSPDTEISRERFAIEDIVREEDDQVEDVVTRVETTTVSTPEETTVPFPVETDAQGSLEEINLQDSEIEQTRSTGQENVEWGFPFAWSIHGLQGDQENRGGQEEEFQSRFEAPRESKEIQGSNVDGQSADGIVPFVESTEDGRSKDEKVGEKMVSFEEIGKPGRFDVDEESEGKVVTPEESKEFGGWRADEESEKKSMTTEATEEKGRSDVDDGRFSVDADNFGEYYKDDTVAGRYEGTVTPDVSKEYAQHDSNLHFQEEPVPVVRSEEYLKSSEEDMPRLPHLNFNFDSSMHFDGLPPNPWGDYVQPDMNGNLDFNDQSRVPDLDLERDPVTLQILGLDEKYEDEESEALRKLKIALIEQILARYLKEDFYSPPFYAHDYSDLYGPSGSDKNSDHGHLFRLARSINTDSSTEVSGKTRNALTEGVKPGALLRQGILGRRAEIEERMQQVRDYDQELLRQNLDKFFDRMEILAAHIDRLHERYHHLNELNDDYVSNEFPAETLDR